MGGQSCNTIFGGDFPSVDAGRKDAILGIQHAVGAAGAVAVALDFLLRQLVQAVVTCFDLALLVGPSLEGASSMVVNGDEITISTMHTS